MPSGENRGRASGSPLGREDRISAAHVLHSRCCLPLNVMPWLGQVYIRAEVLVSAIKTYAYCSVVTRCGDSSNKTVQRECEVRLVQMFDRMIAPECSDFKTATGSGHSSLQRFEPTRAEASVARRKGPIEPMSWRPAVAEFEDSLSLIVSDAKQEARK